MNTNCEICGIEFVTYPSRKAIGNGKYCSRSCQHSALVGDVRERFFSKVTKTETCWNWDAGLNSRGYGHFFENMKDRIAHRFSYEMHFGKVPKGMFVCHKCDNRLCVNPDHLFLGTPSDNILDAKSKGRMAKGIKNGAAKLNNESVKEIRVLNGKMTQREIAKLYNVSLSTINNIFSFKVWSHVA